MAKKTKEKKADLAQEKSKKNNDKKNKTGQKHKKKKNLSQDTKEEKFNFDNEIVIGLKRIDDENLQVKGAKKNSSRNEGKRVKENKGNNSLKKNKQKLKKKLTPKQEKARKKRKIIFKITKWIVLLGIIIGGIVYAMLSPIFNINTIEVSGNSAISTDTIISLSGITLETNMFKYSKNDVISSIKENAYIDTVSVKRILPDTIEIEVTERTAEFMIKVGNAYAYISNQGYILEISSDSLSLPVITGYSTEQEDIKTGSRLCTEDLEKLSDVLKIIEAAKSNSELDKYITEIDITDDEDYILEMEEYNKIIYIGDTANLSTKMLWILKFIEVEGKTEGEIILNMDLNSDSSKPYFRESV